MEKVVLGKRKIPDRSSIRHRICNDTLGKRCICVHRQIKAVVIRFCQQNFSEEDFRK